MQTGGDEVNRPYRDDEEKQRNVLLKLLEDAQVQIQAGDLDAAVQTIVDIEIEFNELDTMVNEFDDDAAFEAEEGE